MKEKLFQPVDIAILVYFRIFGAALISGELINSIFLGDIAHFAAADFHFSYQLFPWPDPWPTWGMVLHYGVTIVAGFLVAAGFFYRYTTVILFLGFTSLFLMEETEYINHTYLYCLITFWMIFMPAHKAFSYDAWKNPEIRSAYAPSWCYYLLLFQMCVVYFYAGVAKLNEDWLQGIPMNMVMPNRGDVFLIGPLLIQPGAHYVVSYFGLIFDLSIAFVLLNKNTRLIGFIFAVAFHLSNVLIFGLATFPWFSIMMSSLFFGTSWPRKLPFFKQHLPLFENNSNNSIRYGGSIYYLIIFYAVLQILIPLRHWLYPGRVDWTEEGHYFSWRMMLRGKIGTIVYNVTIPGTDSTFSESPLSHITYGQYNDLVGKPELIIQYAHFLKEKYQHLSEKPIIVTANTLVSLNGRPEQPIVDPGTDLAAEERSLKHYPWIIPLQNLASE